MQDKSDTGQEPDDYSHVSVWQRVQGIIAFGIAVWIMLSVLSHVVTAVGVLINPQPRIVDVRFGWPSVQVSQPLQQVEGGGVEAGLTGVTPQDGVAAIQGSRAGGIDIKYKCSSNGKTVCRCSVLGFPLPKVICTYGTVFVVCFIIAFILLVLLDWVCNSQWVQNGTETRKLCKKRKCKKWCFCCNKWFCWFESFILWILDTICGWKVLIFWITYVLCVIAAFILILA